MPITVTEWLQFGIAGLVVILSIYMLRQFLQFLREERDVRLKVASDAHARIEIFSNQISVLTEILRDMRDEMRKERRARLSDEPTKPRRGTASYEKED